MSGFRSGEIKLDTSKAVFYSGQLVSGTVSFELNGPLTFSAINIEYLGEAEVLWTENVKEVQLGRERIKEVEYKANEEYFKYTQCLAGGTGVCQLQPGSHALPFKFHIPHTAPSTFEGEVGSVKYCITAAIYFPDPNVMKEALVKDFKVVAPLDLNTGSPDIKNPINLEFEQVYGCDCICSPEPMNVRVNLPVTGYCPGQNIPITVEVDNESSTEINKMIFELIYRERYRSHRLPGEYVPPEETLAKVKKGAIMGKSKKSVTIDLQVPDILPPYLDNCKIIDVAYFVKVTFKLSGCNDDLTDEAEICLGLVPLAEFTKGEYKHPMREELPDGLIPDPKQPLEFAPAQPAFVPPSENPSVQSRFSPAQNTPYPSNIPIKNVGYPQSNFNLPYPTQPNTYPTQPSTYPTQLNPNYPTNNGNNNSRPTSGSYGFVMPQATPRYALPGMQGGFPSVNMNVASPRGISPSAPPPYQ